MKNYLVTNNKTDIIKWLTKPNKAQKKVLIYNQIPLEDIDAFADEIYKLTDLYKDEVFLKSLAKIDHNTVVYLYGLGLDYCSFKANYIKAYTKLDPICKQAGKTFIIDSFAFYNTEKAIYRPFLYIDDAILDSSVKEFYNSGKIYENYEGNKVENYYKKIKPYIDIKTKPIEIETVRYTPTKKEIKEYEALKHDIIMVKKYSKVKVIRILHDFIENTKSKQNAIENTDKNTIDIVRNDAINRKKLYKNIAIEKPEKIKFYSSGYYGVDEIELKRTREALIRHNKLIELING